VAVDTIPPNDFAEIEFLSKIIAMRASILEAIQTAGQRDPALDTSEVQSIINALTADNERLTILLNSYGLEAISNSSKPAKTSSDRPALATPPTGQENSHLNGEKEIKADGEGGEPSGITPNGQATEPSTNGGPIKPRFFTGWNAPPTAKEREVFERTRPKQPN
jgi:hypothetical protein